MQIPESKLETARGKVVGIGRMQTEYPDNSDLDPSLIDSPSPSEGPDKILDASLASFLPGYFDCLCGRKNNVKVRSKLVIPESLLKCWNRGNNK